MLKKKFVVLALLGNGPQNIEGFVNYHAPWVERFEFVHHNAEKKVLDFIQSHPKCHVQSSPDCVFLEEDKGRNLLQEKVDYSLETALMLEVWERFDIRTLLKMTDQPFKADITYGLINTTDNHYLVDFFSRALMSNMKIEFKWHTHCWPTNTLNASKHMLTFPKVNAVVETPWYKPGSDNQWDYDTSPLKYAAYQMASLFMNEKYQDIIHLYEELIKTDFMTQGLSRRVNFYWFMVAVLACDQLDKPCTFPALEFGNPADPTKTEVAIHFIYNKLNGKATTIDLAPYKVNLHGVVSSFVLERACSRGAIDSLLAPLTTMWNP